MKIEPYQIANLEKHQELLKEIKALENKFKTELAQDITLIAYEKSESDSDLGCRSGLNE